MTKYCDYDNHYYYSKFQKINNTWYFFGEQNELQRGWVKINESTYCFDSDGAMCTGKQTFNGCDYVFDDYGKLQSEISFPINNVQTSKNVPREPIKLDDGEWGFDGGLFISGDSILDRIPQNNFNDLQAFYVEGTLLYGGEKNEKDNGVTLMIINEGLDGDISTKSFNNVKPDDSISEIFVASNFLEENDVGIISIEIEETGQILAQYQYTVED